MNFKICIIGCGNHAIKMHGPSLSKYAAEHPHTELAACCDVNEERAKFFKSRFAFNKYYTNIDEMLNREKPNAVSLVLPVELTSIIAYRILQQGYPLIMEKPPGRNKEEVLKLLGIAKKNKVPHQVAFNRRFDPIIRKLKNELDKHCKPNEMHHVRYDMFRVFRNDLDFSTTAIHGIDTVKYLAGSDYKHVRFHYQELPHIGHGVKNTYMECTFMSGAIAHLNIFPVAGVQIERAMVHLYNQTFFAEIPMWFDFDAPGRLVHLINNKIIFNMSGKELSSGTEQFETCGFYNENASFFNDIRAGRMPIDDLLSTLQSVDVADYMRKGFTEFP